MKLAMILLLFSIVLTVSAQKGYDHGFPTQSRYPPFRPRPYNSGYSGNSGYSSPSSYSSSNPSTFYPSSYSSSNPPTFYPSSYSSSKPSTAYPSSYPVSYSSSYPWSHSSYDTNTNRYTDRYAYEPSQFGQGDRYQSNILKRRGHLGKTSQINQEPETYGSYY